MMSCRRALVLAVLIALSPAAPRIGQAAEPTDQLRANIDRLYRTVQRTPSDTTDPEAAAILDGMFEWRTMARASLGAHWEQRTAAEQADFTRLFAALFRRVYVARIHVVDASKFRYLGDTIRGDRAIVKTQVLTRRGSVLAVDYAVRSGPGQSWRIEDVRIEDVSLVENYRTQFDTFIARSSYEALVKKLGGGK